MVSLYESVLGYVVAWVASVASRIGAQPETIDKCSCRCLKAAESGNLPILQSAPHVKWYWLKEISLCAGREGYVDVLQWAREQGFS